MQGLYLVTDRGLCGDKMEDVIVKAVRGGARYVQLREKNASSSPFRRLLSSMTAWMWRWLPMPTGFTWVRRICLAPWQEE
jgi:hypothetical protein